MLKSVAALWLYRLYHCTYLCFVSSHTQLYFEKQSGWIRSACALAAPPNTFSARFEACKNIIVWLVSPFKGGSRIHIKLLHLHSAPFVHSYMLLCFLGCVGAVPEMHETTCRLDLCSVCPTFQLHLTSIVGIGLNSHDQRNIITGKAARSQCQLLTEWNWHWINMKRHPSMRTSSIVSVNCFSSKHYG